MAAVPGQTSGRGGRWRSYSPGSGQTVPYFAKTSTWISGKPRDGKGNIYTPKSFNYITSGGGPVIYPGMEGSSSRGLRF